MIWLGDTLGTLRAFPQDVQDEVGYALYLAQIGARYEGAKPLKGLGSGVLEVIADHRGDTYRAVYTVRRAGVRSSRLPEEVEERHRDTAIGHRLGATAAQASCGVGPEAGGLTVATKKDYVVGGGNVFADLGYARPEEAAAKAELAHKITKIIERRKLTQTEAASVLEVDQPKVSALRRGKLTGFSLDRLVRFLVLLGSDVEIVVKELPRSRRRARLLVA